MSLSVLFLSVCLLEGFFLFSSCQAVYLSMLDCWSAHLSYNPPIPSFIIRLCVNRESGPFQHSPYRQHTVDTTNLTIISSQIISFCLLGWWNGRQQHRGREGGRRRREIRVMGLITYPVHKDTSYETTTASSSGRVLWVFNSDKDILRLVILFCSILQQYLTAVWVVCHFRE